MFCLKLGAKLPNLSLLREEFDEILQLKKSKNTLLLIIYSNFH